MNNKPKVVFFGTPSLTVPFLDALINSDYSISAVITQPDRPAGRKNILTSPPVKKLAEQQGIKIIQVETLREELIQEDKSIFDEFGSLKADVYVVVAFGLIIPERVFSIPKFGAINVHPSLLPKYRGASPIQSAILNNDRTTGITIMKLDSGMDTGPIIDQMEIKLTQDETTPTLTEKITKIGPAFLIKTLNDYLNGKLVPEPQDNSKSSTTKQLTKKDGQIDWSQPAHKIESQIRAYQFWPGSYTFFNNTKIEILSARVSKADEVPASGTVLSQSNNTFVATGQDLLELIKIKPASKNEMTAGDFIRGHKDFVGTVLK